MNLEGANSGGLGDGSPPVGSRSGAPVGGLGTLKSLVDRVRVCCGKGKGV